MTLSSPVLVQSVKAYYPDCAAKSKTLTLSLVTPQILNPNDSVSYFLAIKLKGRYLCPIYKLMQDAEKKQLAASPMHETTA